MATHTPVTLVHPFLVDIVEPDHIWYAAWGEHPLARVEGDPERCALCGQKITWRVVVSSDGKHYTIGRDCAVSISNMPQAEITHRSKMAAKRSKKAAELAALRTVLEGLASTAGLASLPHPMRGKRPWAAKLTMVDYCRYWLDCKSVKIDDLKRANGLAQAALNDLRVAIDADVDAYFRERAADPVRADKMYSGFDVDRRRRIEDRAAAAYEQSHPAM